MDASTAILLAKAELLDLFLSEIRQPVMMPREVVEECGARDSPDAQWIGRAIEEGRLTVASGPGRSPQRRGIEQLRTDFTLGLGEAAALASAVNSGTLVATDDKRAINACKLLRVPFTTALSILVRLREKRAIDRQDAFERLEILARVGRYKKEMITAARKHLEDS